MADSQFQSWVRRNIRHMGIAGSLVPSGCYSHQGTVRAVAEAVEQHGPVDHEIKDDLLRIAFYVGEVHAVLDHGADERVDERTSYRFGVLGLGAWAGRCVFRYSLTTAMNSPSETVPLPSLSVLQNAAFIASGTSPIVRAASPLASSR